MLKNGLLYSIQWGHHRKDPPPDGMNPVQFKGFALSSHPAHTPPEIDAFYTLHGYGSGWATYVQSVSPPAKRRSEESRGKTRVKNLEKRVAKTIGPMFSEEIVQRELSKQPDYFAGKGDPKHDAYIAQSDAEDAQLWAEFCAWAQRQEAV